MIAKIEEKGNGKLDKYGYIIYSRPVKTQGESHDREETTLLPEMILTELRKVVGEPKGRFSTGHYNPNEQVREQFITTLIDLLEQYNLQEEDNIGKKPRGYYANLRGVFENNEGSVTALMIACRENNIAKFGAIITDMDRAVLTAIGVIKDSPDSDIVPRVVKGGRRAFHEVMRDNSAASSHPLGHRPNNRNY